MNESETRAELIDPALKEAGWGVVEGSLIKREYQINKGRLIGQGRRQKALFADYLLVYKNRRMAIVEAKARDKHYTDGVAQAKDYAERLNIRYTFSTNGIQIYSMDMEKGVEGDVKKYPSPEELWEMTFPKPESNKEIEAEDWKERFFSFPFEDKGGTWQPRYYQENAITRVLEGVAEGKDRLLLTLATGTGKTAISFQIAWKLFHAKWNLRRDRERSPRILFLADRNILADQAFISFGSFEEDALVRIAPDEIKKKGRVPKNGSIFFTIFQTFMSGPDETPYFGDYPEDYFDFIIIDECHRGGANDEGSWRAIMEHFSPAVQLGLTATPRRDVNKDTYKYFGEPVYTYSLKEGINDGFLTPFRVKEIQTTLDTYQYKGSDVVEFGEVDENKEYSESDFNTKIQIKEREEYRVKLLLEQINQNQKTLVFCATQVHAAVIRDIINQHSDSKNPNYCHRVTADDLKLGEQHLKAFQDNEKTIPTVLTTSKKLSTGVDAPEVRNIVLLRPVKSMVEFKQIVGRGTRLFEGKDYFTIYDFVKAHKHFKDPEWDGDPIEKQPPNGTGGKTCVDCGQKPCVCGKSGPKPCDVCGYHPCICDTPPGGKMIKVKLGDGKDREIDSMIQTSFWSPEGKPITSAEFIQRLFGDLPKFFQSESDLRKIWSAPDTRRKLLTELEESGYSHDQLEDLRQLVHGEDSDLYDVLSYIAYHRDLVKRLDRAEKVKIHLQSYNPAQQDFLNFVLSQYVKEGVSELDDKKLPDLLELNYNTISDAKSALGDIPSIRRSFIDFQGSLYEEVG